jgi:hypothetical protein
MSTLKAIKRAPALIENPFLLMCMFLSNRD